MSHELGIANVVGRAWRQFPAVTTLGFYDSFAQYIELSQVSSSELRLALAGSDPRTAVRVLPLLIHELQHWTDHLSTLWGRLRLIRALEAMEARASNDPKAFWRIVSFRRIADADYFSTYYQTVESTSPSNGPTRPWRWELSGGLRFNVDGHMASDRPVFFTRFAWPEGSTACRVPFSVSTLLEVRAMAAELAAHRAFAADLPDSEATIEMALASRRQLDRLYDAELATYSAAAHLVGNVVGFADAMLAFSLASQLSHLCMDMPSELFSRVQVPKHFAPWTERIPAAVMNRDRGFLFLVLTHHAEGADRDSPESWLEEVAARAGLPQLHEIRELADAECEQLRATSSCGRFGQRLAHLWEQGTAIREAYRYSDLLCTSPTRVPMPPIYCNDLAWLLPAHLGSRVTESDVEDWWLSCNRLAVQFEEFTMACGV